MKLQTGRISQTMNGGRATTVIKAASTNAPYRPSEVDAYIMAKKLIEPQLKAPSTAEFTMVMSVDRDTKYWRVISLETEP